MIALHQLGYRGLVTNNYRMLQNPIELAAILKTKLRVFALQGVGDDPVRATRRSPSGLALSYQGDGIREAWSHLAAPA